MRFFCLRSFSSFFVNCAGLQKVLLGNIRLSGFQKVMLGNIRFAGLQKVILGKIRSAGLQKVILGKIRFRINAKLKTTLNYRSRLKTT